jgi:hypothetical protein
LREGGMLLVGWNDVFPRNRIKPDDVRALSRFDRAYFGSFGTRLRVPVAHGHVFDFYRKPAELG